MAYEHKPGTGSIFKNTHKEIGDNKPDYKGEGMDTEGNPVEFALWVKEGKDGKKFFSVSFGRKQKPAEVPPQKELIDPPFEAQGLPF